MGLIPLFAHDFFYQHYNRALIIFVAAGLTDLVDGWIARRFNMKSRLGSMLDPLADKLLMTAALLLLAEKNHLPWHFTLLIVGRDSLILLGVAILFSMKIRLFFTPTLTSKWATFSQLTVLSMVLLQIGISHNQLAWQLWPLKIIESLLPWIMLASSLLTTITCFQYGLLGYRFYRYGDRL